jgi:membrane-associated protease RseP (regulator of RpoE activity)
LLIVLFAVVAYFLIIIGLWKSGLAARFNISFAGPIAMVRTDKGKKLLDYLSRPRKFWTVYAKVSRVLFLVGMAGMLLLLIWEATLVFQIPKQSIPAPQTYLLLPGINPFVPVGYGILGLVIAVVLHELSHGILSRAQDIKVKSMGVLFMIVPIGAFVEPDQEQLDSVEPLQRLRVFGVGPATNLFVALIFLLILVFPMMGVVAPIHTGLAVVSVYDGSSAYSSGIRDWSEIVAIGGQHIANAGQFNSITGVVPGSSTGIEYIKGGHFHNASVVAGVVITGIVPSSPAQKAGLRPGLIIYSMNNSVVYSINGLLSNFNSTVPNQTIPFAFITQNGTTLRENITLSSVQAVEGVSQHGKQIGFLGIMNPAYMGMNVVPVSAILSFLRNPFYGASSPGSIPMSALQFLLLPFEGLSPVPQGLQSLFTAGGLSGGGLQLFWMAVNSFYWIFWINLWVGLFNMLPAVPLDGGYLFKDNLRLLLKRIQGNRSIESRERTAGLITRIFSVLILVLLLWQILGPRLIYL